MTPDAPEPKVTASIRLRMGPSDAAYAHGLVPGARVLAMFGDVQTELAIREGGDEGLTLGYDSVELTEPVFVGDFIEARGEVVSRGNTSRKVEMTAHKIIAGSSDGSGKVLDPPVLVAKGASTLVVGTKDRVAAAGS